MRVRAVRLNGVLAASVVGLGLVGVLVHWPTLLARAETGSVYVAAANSGSEPNKTVSQRRSWEVREFSSVRLVPRETGSSANEHPVRLDAETVRQLLGQLRLESRDGAQPLLVDDEVAELAEPLTQALANATVDDDVLLVSTSRRGGGPLAQRLAVTARLFVQGGSLNFIVHDSRFEFYDRFRATRTAPEFTFGSRQNAGVGVITAVSGASKRADWVALSLATSFGAAPLGAAMPGAAAPSAAPTPSRASAPASEPAAATVPRARDAQFADDIEQRLLTLQRLRDNGVISEQEYQNKRSEILRLL